MGLIGRFIDDAVAAHPALMRTVLDRPFGELHEWVHFDEAGEACGCLVGSIALAAGARAVRDEIRIDAADERDGGTARAAMFADGCAASLAADALGLADADSDDGFGWMRAHDVGVRVAYVCARSARRAGSPRAPWGDRVALANARTVDLLKRRIARRLAEREVRYRAARGDLVDGGAELAAVLGTNDATTTHRGAE